MTASRTVDLAGPLNDASWDRLVADLRETFQAAGTISRDGSLRLWKNGNLHVMVEPFDSGHRIRFHTLNEGLRLGVVSGTMAILMGLIVLLVLIGTGDLITFRNLIAFFALMLAGLGSLGYAGLRLPRWSREREQQMEELGIRAINDVNKSLTAPARPEEVIKPPGLEDGDEEKETSRVPGRTRTRS